MQKYVLLVPVVLALFTAGCADSAPLIKAVPLGSFVAFEDDPGIREIIPGDIVAADHWAIVVPRLPDDETPRTGLRRNEWRVLPYEAASRALCENELVSIKSHGDEDGVARCVRSDGSRGFTAQSFW